MSSPQRWMRPWPRHARLPWLLSALLLGGAVMLALDACQLAGDAAADRARAAQLHKQSRPKAAPRPSAAKAEMQKRWAALRAERAFNWYPIFLAIERSSEADIELLAFEPDKRGGRITLRGEARDIAALSDYLARLSDQGVFTEVYLAQEKAKLRDRLPSTIFEIRATLFMP